MGIIYNKFIEYYNGKNFNLTPSPFVAEDTYNQLGEVRKRSAEAILSLENLIESTHNKNHTHDDRYYLKNEVDIKIANVASNGHIDLSSYATIESLKSKVDKIQGKTLTSNDYTNAEKAKLAELVNYIHPSTHDARMVFFSDGQDLQQKLNNGSLGSGSSGGGSGTDGQDGSTWYSIEGTPTSVLGKIGDFCIDKISYNYYKKLSSTIWNLEGNLKGGTGQAGANGINGKSIEYEWSGTFLRLRQSGGSWGTYVNLKGEKGDIGLTGDTGVGLNFIWQGTSLGVKRENETEYKVTNLKGEKGDPTNISIGEITLGVDDTDYRVTMTGTAPNLLLNMKLPKGEKGEKGDKGGQGDVGVKGDTGVGLNFNWQGTSLGIKREDETEYRTINLKGEKGDIGFTPDFRIGEVTLGDSETDYFMSITGVSPNLLLNMRIPRGQKGDKGDKGEGGIDGKSLEFTWLGTQLGIRKAGETIFSYVNLKGEKGDIGATGKGLEYQWTGTTLQIRQEGGAWSNEVDLKGKIINEKDGSELKIWFGTQLEYDNIISKDPNIAYLIKERLTT